jgi:hypothetical protein
MNVIGAWATIRWADTGESLAPVYFSFGEYDEENSRDSFGVRDENIFFYCVNEGELRELMGEGRGEDFTVLDYTLEVTA